MLMSDIKGNSSGSSEFKTNGLLTKKGVKIEDQSSVDALSSRGYGTTESGVFTMGFHESLYLLDKGMLEVCDRDGHSVDFQTLLQAYESVNENAWVNFLEYRDLRSRGYVVREGFGSGIDFRVYERGAYGKDKAAHLILGAQEGKPVPIETLTAALQQCLSQKKELILAVMNRRGEIVYYSVSQLAFK